MNLATFLFLIFLSEGKQWLTNLETNNVACDSKPLPSKIDTQTNSQILMILLKRLWIFVTCSKHSIQIGALKSTIITIRLLYIIAYNPYTQNSSTSKRHTNFYAKCSNYTVIGEDQDNFWTETSFREKKYLNFLSPFSETYFLHLYPSSKILISLVVWITTLGDKCIYIKLFISYITFEAEQNEAQHPTPNNWEY